MIENGQERNEEKKYVKVYFFPVGESTILQTKNKSFKASLQRQKVNSCFEEKKSENILKGAFTEQFKMTQ